MASPSKCLHQSSAFQPIKNNFMCTSQQVAIHNSEDMTASTMVEPPRGGTHKDSLIHDFHGIYNNHSCIVNNMQHQLPADHDDVSSKKIAATAPHCGSSTVVEMVEGNVGNYSINRSVSGSNNGSNGQNGSSTAVNAGGMNTENNNGIAGSSQGGDASGSGSGSGSGSANRIDQKKTSQREAALNKFRQKRQERCFRKKVGDVVLISRYHHSCFMHLLHFCCTFTPFVWPSKSFSLHFCLSNLSTREKVALEWRNYGA